MNTPTPPADPLGLLAFAIVELAPDDRRHITRADADAVVYNRLGPKPTEGEPETVLETACAVIGGEFASLADVAAHLATPPVRPPRVPACVGPAQLRIAMRRLHGITAGQIHAAISAMPTGPEQDDARDLWDYATAIRRDHALVTAFSAGFSLTPEQVDEVFRLAATI